MRRHHVKKRAGYLRADKFAHSEAASSYDKPKKTLIHSTE
jgi:hypothetical protein